MPLDMMELTLAVVVGTLAAIVYSLRVLVLMERRVARMELHLEKLVQSVLKEELVIEKSLKKKKK
jgi:hypothetical protein